MSKKFSGHGAEVQDCVVYARYSSHSQRDVSIEQQVADCQKYAAENNLNIVKIYADRALSGTNDKRPEFQKMLKDAEKGRWKAVLTWKVDRFARNRYDSATYKYKLKRYGVKVVYVKEAIPDGPEGILLESILEGSAEYYSANLSQNVRRGMHYNALECKVNGSFLPLGYCKGPDGRYAVVDAEAEVVREIFQNVADGVPFVNIANELNGRGIRTKTHNLWGRTSFQTLLKNETYIGVYKFSDVRIEGGVPAIVDKALFLKVQERLKNKNRLQGRHRETGEYMLTGKLFCGHCASPMTGLSGTSHTGALYHYYACQNRTHKKGCKKSNIVRDWLENLIVQYTYEYILKDDVIHWLADSYMEYQKQEEHSAALCGLREELAQKQKEIDNVLKAVKAGIFTASTQNLLVDLEAERKRIEDAICVEEAQLTHVERDFIIYWLEKFKDARLSEAAFRRKMIDALINAVYIWDDTIRIAFNYFRKGPSIELELLLKVEAEVKSVGSSCTLPVARPKFKPS